MLKAELARERHRQNKPGMPVVDEKEYGKLAGQKKTKVPGDRFLWAVSIRSFWRDRFQAQHGELQALYFPRVCGLGCKSLCVFKPF